MSDACIRCGACCASFRVSFYWAETDAHPSGCVPEALTEPVSPYFVAMKGTNQARLRCVALQGEIGQAAGCGIYALRSTTCRDFEMGDERCLAARALHGLPPLPPL
ncbi:hypothetical protein DTO96_100304 [Ephemeroptericola cinctiostellae]|uniref:Zinc/iron-chelating domain-containing protein n=1 Tax=Ephemeroptericola cinctiostellae TaxID=2268024 RepID=A0A345D8A7_9BURK|nr:YkgJ family cysteine cluster protein [Ephemeroptericola cinctiostellae]AXF84595.1 hypothetical protein DTO96_100304 [Ephemeroptericola cinctiostellae]